MKSVIKLLILLVVAVCLAIFMQNSTGYATFVINNTRYTMTLSSVVIGLLFCFTVLYFLIRLLSGIFNIPNNFRRWRTNRRQGKELDLFERGWVQWLEGRNDVAEKDLKRLQNKTQSPSRQVVAALAATKAAHIGGNIEKRNENLEFAEQHSLQIPQLYDATMTVKSEILLDEGNGKEALPILEKLDHDNPSQINILKLKLRAYKQCNRLREIIKTTRYLMKKKQIDRLEGARLIEKSAAGLISNPNETLWESVFQTLSAEEQRASLVAIAAAQRYKERGDSKNATKVLWTAIDHNKDSRLINVYAFECPEQEISERLVKIQKWLDDDYENPDLLNAAAYLCMVKQLWGQAQRYLEKSLSVREDSQTYSLLGSLFDRLGRAQEAMLQWRKASALRSYIPQLATEKYLPPADTMNDPEGPPDIKNPNHHDDHLLRKAIMPKLNGLATPSDNQSDEYYYYYDSAPIPGIMSESDEPSNDVSNESSKDK